MAVSVQKISVKHAMSFYPATACTGRSRNTDSSSVRSIYFRSHQKVGLAVVFHQGENQEYDGLVCCRSATYPTGIVPVTDNEEVLVCFSRFVVRCVMHISNLNEAVQCEWHKACRSLGRREEAYRDRLVFDLPDLMVAFNRQATSLPDVIAKVLLVCRDKNVKIWQARSQCPTSIVSPTDILQIQQCVRWAIHQELSLPFLEVGHSNHCLWPDIES